MAYRLQALKECCNCACVFFCELRKCVPRHDRRQHAAVGALPGLNGSHNLLPSPAADAGLLVGRDVATDENTLPGNFEATSDPPRKRELSGFPKKYPGVWQSLQPPIVTRYSPRAIAGSSAAAPRGCSPKAEVAKHANPMPNRNMLTSLRLAAEAN